MHHHELSAANWVSGRQLTVLAWMGKRAWNRGCMYVEPSISSQSITFMSEFIHTGICTELCLQVLITD